jgi:hypothetical protein
MRKLRRPSRLEFAAQQEISGALELGLRGIRLLALAALLACAIGMAQANDPLSYGSESAQQQARVFLKSLPREWSGNSTRDCKTYEDKNIDKVSGPFAVMAAEFLRAFVNVHGQVTITSAYRTAQEQACVCEGEKGPCAGRPRIVRGKKGRRIVKPGGTSHHQDGIALDVRPGTGSEDEFVCLHEFAQFNAQFGVRFPLGKHDRPHMEPAAAGRKGVRLALLGAPSTHLTPCAKMKIMLTDAPVD